MSINGFNTLTLRHSTIRLSGNTNPKLGIGCYDIPNGGIGLTQSNAVFGFMAFLVLAKQS
jgi:hypothetical protein